MKAQELFPELYDETPVDPLIKKIFDKELKVPEGFKIGPSDGQSYELRMAGVLREKYMAATSVLLSL